MNWQDKIYENLVEEKKETTKELIARERKSPAARAERRRKRWKTKGISGMRGLTPGEAAEFGGDTTNDPRTTGRRG